VIPKDFITEWRKNAPWVNDMQVELDLAISRVLVEIYKVSELANSLAFRGGTALYKLYTDTPVRYSEDIDLVQISSGPIGPILDKIRPLLDPWLGIPQRVFKEGRVNLVYRFKSEDMPPIVLRLKIEINTREHFSVLGFITKRFEVKSRWFSGASNIRTYYLEELLGTKLRALYQRKKGRDLFDLCFFLKQGNAESQQIIACFEQYLLKADQNVSRANFEYNLANKQKDRNFINDVEPFLKKGIEWDTFSAAKLIQESLISRLKGDPLKHGVTTKKG
jgi:predicted nucleotidyltransferase component of viral defense system